MVREGRVATGLCLNGDNASVWLRTKAYLAVQFREGKGCETNALLLLDRHTSSHSDGNVRAYFDRSVASILTEPQ